MLLGRQPSSTSANTQSSGDSEHWEAGCSCSYACWHSCVLLRIVQPRKSIARVSRHTLVDVIEVGLIFLCYLLFVPPFVCEGSRYAETESCISVDRLRSSLNG